MTSRSRRPRGAWPRLTLTVPDCVEAAIFDPGDESHLAVTMSRDKCGPVYVRIAGPGAHDHEASICLRYEDFAELAQWALAGGHEPGSE